MMSEQDLVEIVQIAVADLSHEENDAGKKSFTLPKDLQTSQKTLPVTLGQFYVLPPLPSLFAHSDSRFPFTLMLKHLP